jgi:hypothetical protein
MQMLFNAGGDLETTDYWISEDGARAEAAWVTIRHGQWHLVIRQSPQNRLKQAVALPVTAHDQPHGWQWKLWLKLSLDWAIHIPVPHFLGDRLPLMPLPGQYYRTSLHLYGHFLPGLLQNVTYSFGHFDQGVVQRIYTIPLIVGRAGPDWRETVRNHMRI